MPPASAREPNASVVTVVFSYVPSSNMNRHSRHASLSAPFLSIISTTTAITTTS